MSIPTVAIVGAGFSGLVCGNILSQNRLEVTMFDKGRSPGGRLASRDRDENTFDYGAQYFSARDSRFKQFLAPLLESRTVARWNGRFGRIISGSLAEETPAEPRYVGAPLMRSIVSELAGSVNCNMSHRITSVSRHNGKWLLTGVAGNESDQHKLGPFDFLVLSLPPAQAAALQPHPELSSFRFRPCIALLLAFSEEIKLEFDGVKLDDRVISWVARDSSKPGRGPGERWVIHASPDWSEEHFEKSNDDLARLLAKRYATIFGIAVPEPQFAKLHKWRYALPVVSKALGCIFERDLSLAYCGDWCEGARVEGAFLSGLAAAEAIMQAKSNHSI